MKVLKKRWLLRINLTISKQNIILSTNSKLFKDSLLFNVDVIPFHDVHCSQSHAIDILRQNIISKFP